MKNHVFLQDLLPLQSIYETHHSAIKNLPFYLTQAVNGGNFMCMKFGYTYERCCMRKSAYFVDPTAMSEQNDVREAVNEQNQIGWVADLR